MLLSFALSPLTTPMRRSYTSSLLNEYVFCDWTIVFLQLCSSLWQLASAAAQ